LIIYLNDDYEGGRTTFYPSVEKGVETEGRVSITPRRGTALIFNHDSLHEGEAVTKGMKYILRTEIMFQRVDTDSIVDKDAYLHNPNYLKVLFSLSLSSLSLSY